MLPHEYAAFDATGLRDLVRDGNVSGDELEAVARKCIELVDPALAATVEVLPEAPSSNSQGTLAGVPFGVKDLGSSLQGVRQGLGTHESLGFVSGQDSAVGRRWRNAGLRIVCRTTTPEFGTSVATESRHFLPTRNPWDLSRSPGGSSGGSAALVAAGALPWAHANDAAGSIRIPAALCGLVGLKPTRGRVSVGPADDEWLNGLSGEFAITRSVRDAALLLDVASGSEPGDYFVLPEPRGSYERRLDGPMERLRVGVSVRPQAGGPVHPAAQAAVGRVASLLSDLGHDVVERNLELDEDLLVRTTVTLIAASVAETVRLLTGAREPEAVRKLLDLQTFALANLGWRLSWHEVNEALAARNHISRRAAQSWGELDALLTPTTAQPAWQVGALDPFLGSSPEGWLRACAELTGFTLLFNVTGQPALSLPVALTQEGLPIGVQLVARQAQEELLLRLAAAVEREVDFPRHGAPHHVSNLV